MKFWLNLYFFYKGEKRKIMILKVNCEKLCKIIDNEKFLNVSLYFYKKNIGDNEALVIEIIFFLYGIFFDYLKFKG